jgi:hypothetical protein
LINSFKQTQHAKFSWWIQCPKNKIWEHPHKVLTTFNTFYKSDVPLVSNVHSSPSSPLKQFLYTYDMTYDMDLLTLSL